MNLNASNDSSWQFYVRHTTMPSFREYNDEAFAEISTSGLHAFRPSVRRPQVVGQREPVAGSVMQRKRQKSIPGTVRRVGGLFVSISSPAAHSTGGMPVDLRMHRPQGRRFKEKRAPRRRNVGYTRRWSRPPVARLVRAHHRHQLPCAQSPPPGPNRPGSERNCLPKPLGLWYEPAQGLIDRSRQLNE